MIHKAISWRLEAFLGAIKTGLFNSGILLPAMLLLSSGYAIAQVKSDGTTNTTVNSIDNNFNIINGIEKSNNLFHSFSNFSIPTGGTATFNLINTPNINTIFSRVTGGNTSNIDGLIRTVNSNNPVSLFLMNPNGIIFGQNAKLDIGGSFMGTTANSIKFADGSEFSAVNTSSQSLLTMSVPVGLQMGTTLDATGKPLPQGSIALQGVGHRLASENIVLLPFFYTVPHQGLAVKAGQTLALVGSKIDLNGGILSAPEGLVELGGVMQGNVGLNTNASGFSLNYGGVSEFGDIQLRERSLVDANGINAGSIQVQGRQVTFTDGSGLWLQNRGSKPPGELIVSASDSFKIIGFAPDMSIRSGIISEAVGTAPSGNIILSSPHLTVEDGANILSRNYGASDGGSLTINTSKLDIKGYASIAPSIYSAVAALTFSPGKAGDVKVTTRQLSLLASGYLGSSTFSSASGGNVTIDADQIEVSGVSPIGVTSLINAGTIGRGGNAGDLSINTRTLGITQSGTVSTSSIGVGNAGNININASESIEVTGKAPTGPYGSGISSTVYYPLPVYSEVFGLSGNLLGSSGNITVNTPKLKVGNIAGFISSNYGVGNAGTITINSQSIELKNYGYISALTVSGEGGNTDIKADQLILRENSQIETTAGTQGNGGNITINAPIIVGLENSDITANAVAGRGGNIEITTQGIFGLKYRPQLTPGNDITASSQFGINGTVDINNFGVDPNSGLVELPVNLVDSSKLIATGCSANQDSSFVATGRGGVPQNPLQQVWSDRTWSDTRDISVYRKTQALQAQIPIAPETLIQATSWHRNAQGKIELVGDLSPTQVQQRLTCAAVTKS
jgi:filamentous hemagglutinin family protein